MHVLLGGLLAIAAQVTVSEVPRPPAADSASDLVTQGKNPYARIFRAPQRGPIARSVPEVPNRQSQDMHPRVVCGTVVVPVKPDSDAKMVVSPNTGVPQPEYRIRKIAPTICNE
jgi:hypothetical protein